MNQRVPEVLYGIGIILGVLSLLVLAAMPRTSCLDRFQRLELEPVFSGKWETSAFLDPMDESGQVDLSLVADIGVSRWGDPAILHIRCRRGQLEIYIDWHEYIGGAGNGEDHYLTCRLGMAKPVLSRWSYSTSGEASFYEGYSGLSTCEFVLALLDVDQFVAEVAPFMENPITAVFDVRGLAAFPPELLAECE